MEINRQTYEEYFLLYADGELTDTEKLEVEEFVDQNPDLGQELEMITQTVMVPDETIVFANKEILLKEESNRKVIGMGWMKFAAAAAVLIAVSAAGWMFLNDDLRQAPPVAVVQQQEKAPVAEKTTPVEVQPPVSIKTAPKKIISAPQFQKVNRPERKTEAEQDQPAVSSEEPVENKVPEAAPVTNDIAFNEAPSEPIDIQVEPRQVTQEDLATNTSNVHYARALAEEQEKGDQIYFANTQLPKKTKLRGVLRKASRYLERVTTIQ